MAIKLVLVDDHPLVLGGLKQLLSAEPDFEVLATCGTVEEAWRAIDSHTPDVVILDLNLPGEDGLSLLRRLGWEAQIQLKDGIRSTYAWYQGVHAAASAPSGH